MPIWDERFSAPGYAYGSQPNDFLREQLARLPRGKVLSLGEGEGRNGVFLAEHGFEVTAVDGSRVGLQKAQGLATERGVRIETVVADLAEYAIAPNAWDVIVSIWCHLPPALRGQVHRAAVAGLKPGGAFLLEAYTPRQLEFRTGGPPVAELLMTREGLSREFDGLELEIARELEREIHEGSFHSGPSAVVQVLGFKRAPSAG